MSSETVDKIIRAAESQARTGGYNAFSFREIAKEIGIKSASIHYHFPTKADLAKTLAHRYTEKFERLLQDITASQKSLHDQLTDYADLFYQEKMCLCGLFAAEMDILPEEVKTETRHFFEANLNWLENVLKVHKVTAPEAKSIKLLANMEGAMLLGKAFESEKYFRQAINLTEFMDPIE